MRGTMEEQAFIKSYEELTQGASANARSFFAFFFFFFFSKSAACFFLVGCSLALLFAALYNTTDSSVRQRVEAQLAQICSSPAYLVQAHALFQHSENSFALHHVCRKMRELFTERWATFPYNQKVSTLVFLVQYLGQKGLTLQPWVVLEVSLLIVRISKLGWFEGSEMKELVGQCSKFMTSVTHAPLGLRLLTLLVTEMNEVMPGTTMSQHRKLCTSFRDRSLLPIFQTALSAHRKVLEGNVVGQQREVILGCALELSHKCLSFDFIGTQPAASSEKSDDAATVQVPNTWRDLFESEGVLKLFFSVYRSTQPATAKTALQCLTQVASVRRSVFTGTAEREDFLTELMRGICEIIRTGAGLQDPTNHHELCRLLARMKANFQLKQIIKCPVYNEWIVLMANFTSKSFQAWQWAPNSVYYLLSLWSRLVASIAYLQPNEDTKLDTLAPVVLEAYVRSRLSSVEAVMQSNGQIEDPLEATSLREEMEVLPTLGRLKFALTSAMLTSLFDPLASVYDQRLMNLSKAEAFVLESKLTWLVQIIAAILGGRLATSATPEMDKLDGELSARLFRLMKLHDQRVQSPNFTPSPSTPGLELALLRFLQEFRKVYIGDYATAASSIYGRLQELLGLTDPNAVLALILQKICSNLRFWAKNKHIVERTLSLCNTISSGYTSGKLLRKVELTNHLFGHHTSQFFPFLDVQANARGRTHFYNTLAKLLFLDCSVREFNAFMVPFGQVFLRLLSVNGREQFRQPVVSAAVTGLMRDLRGVVDATVSGPTYNMFFDWLYENKAPNGARFSDTLVRIAEVFYDVPDVTSPLLKFVAELVLNKSSRVAFDSSSPNGILLFRLASEVLVAYGTNIFDVQVPPSKAYNNRYKGIWIALKILRNALQGGFCNYGVFQLYRDPALANALNIVFKLMFSVPLNQVMAFPKFTEAHFAFLDTLCSDHTSTVATLEPMIFRQMLDSFKEGLGALDQAICSHCCSSIDKLADFFYHNQDRDTATANGIKKLVIDHMGQFNDLLAILFQILCFEPQCLFQWSISRPMLALIVINPQNFNNLKVKLCQSMLTADQAQRMQEALRDLMAEIEPNLSGKNRDLFTQRLSSFRHVVQGIQNNS